MNKCFCHFNGYEVKDAKARPVNNISTMKSMTNLVAGNVIKTLGYHEPNDGGGATYLIRDKSSIDVEDLGSIHFIGEYLVAELLKESSFINVKTFGVKGDGITDETSLIQSILSNNKNILFPKGTYLISDTLKLISDSNIYLDNAKIYSTSEINQDYIFNIAGISNVYIKGVNSILEMVKSPTENQACIMITRSQNVKVEGLELVKAGGDGIIIAGTETNITTNIDVNNCIIDNSRRNGISLIGGLKGVTIRNSYIKNTSGTEPQVGIDIETWQNTLFNENIIIDNCKFDNNTNGDITIFENTNNVKIKNCIFNHSVSMKVNNGYVDSYESHPKNIEISNNIFNYSPGVYGYRTQLISFIVKDNTFNASRIYLDTDIAITDELTLKGEYKVISGNIFNGGTIHLHIANTSNLDITNNVFNKPNKYTIQLLGCRNSIVKGNIFNGYNILNDTTLAYCIYINGATKNTFIEENIIRKTDDTNSVDYIISVHNNARNIIVRKNNFTDVLYKYDIIYVPNTDRVFDYENIYSDIMNKTIQIPTASELYAGTIITRKISGVYVPYICVHNGTEYVWKRISYVE